MTDTKLEKFLSAIEREWAWRQRELIFFRQALAEVADYQQRTMTRAGILLLYAHWEGFIKQISQKFLECFTNEDIGSVPRYVIASHLAQMYGNLLSKYTKIGAADNSLNCLSEGATVCNTIDGIINTEANLDSKNLKKITDSVGVDFAEFETRVQFIDRIFVSVRHAIAHGEGRPLAIYNYIEIEKGVTELMRIFKKNIIDSAAYANKFWNSGNQNTCLKIKI